APWLRSRVSTPRLGCSFPHPIPDLRHPCPECSIDPPPPPPPRSTPPPTRTRTHTHQHTHTHTHTGHDLPTPHAGGEVSLTVPSPEARAGSDSTASPLSHSLLPAIPGTHTHTHTHTHTNTHTQTHTHRHT